MPDERGVAAADPRLLDQDASARHAGYAFELKRRLEAAVEGDPERLRAIARGRRNKRNRARSRYGPWTCMGRLRALLWRWIAVNRASLGPAVLLPRRRRLL